MFLRKLGAEAGEGAEDLQSATNHHEERDCIGPVAEADREGVLVGGAGNGFGFFTFCAGYFDDRAAHAFSRSQRLKPFDLVFLMARLKSCPSRSCRSSSSSIPAPHRP